MPTSATTSDEEPQWAAAPAPPDVTEPDGSTCAPSLLGEQFPASPRGARLARRFAVQCMAQWGHPAPSDAACAVALVVSELTSNAVLHGRVPGHTFSLRLGLDATAGLVRIEVADAAAGKRPPGAPPASFPDGESGRGLLLVDVLAERWGTVPRLPLGKTVWAEVSTGR